MEDPTQRVVELAVMVTDKGVGVKIRRLTETVQPLAPVPITEYVVELTGLTVMAVEV